MPVRATGRGGNPYVPTLQISSERSAERAVIRIEDNADGMPPAVVAKIFTPFFTTKPAGKGTGLGLAMSADIVREHGGTIQVNTEPGQFTEMVIDLPLQPPAKLGAAEGATVTLREPDAMPLLVVIRTARHGCRPGAK